MRFESLRIGSLVGLLMVSAWGTVAAPLPPQTLPEGWEIYVQKPQSSFGLWLPQKNRKLFQGEGSTSVKGVKIGHRVLECEIKDDVTLRVLAIRIDLPRGETTDTQTMIELGREIYLKQFPGDLDKEELSIKKKEYEGTEYRITLKDGKDGPLARLRVIPHSIPKFNRVILYQVSVTGTKEQVDGKTAKLLFDSFRHAGNVAEYVKDAPNSKSPNNAAGEETAWVGPKGPNVKRRVDLENAMIGLEYRLGEWAGEKCIADLAPIHDRDKSGNLPMREIAKDGYAVAGAEVHLGKEIDGIKLIYAKVKSDGSLDLKDSYSGALLGYKGPKSEVLANDGRKVLGIRFRQGAVVDALALFMEKK